MLYRPFYYIHTLLGIFLISNQASGQCVSVGSGNWNAASTWSCGDPAVSRVPLCTDVPITIAEGHAVSISDQLTYNCANYMVIFVEGTLSFVNGRKLTLPAGSFVGGNGTILPPSPAGGSSTLIEIGNEIVWNTAAGPVFGPFQFPASHPLPIHLLSFGGHAAVDAVQFSWMVASEVNNDYFVIERSPDMVTWSVVHTEPGNGNSNQMMTYRGQDASPIPGMMYYRLSQTDFDGTREVFDPISIQFRPGSNKIPGPILFPNPLNLSNRETLYIDNLNNDIDRITFTDLNGRTIQKIDHSENSNNPTQIAFDHSVYRSGIYYVILEGPFGIKTAKLLIH